MNKYLITVGMTLGGLLATCGVAGAANPSGSKIYGYRADSPEAMIGGELDLGWYEMSVDGVPTLLWLDQTEVMPTYFISGWVRNGKLQGLYGNRSTCLEVEYDVNTGTLTNVREIEIQGENAYKYMFTAAYNPDDDYVYGFSFDEKFEKDFFVRAPASDVSQVEIVRRMPNDYTMCMSLCFNTTDHHIYGIDFLGDLIRIDTNGNFEVAGFYGLDDDSLKLGNWASGMTYSPLDNCYFWNRQINTYDSTWVRIDADTYQFTNVKNLPFRHLYTVLECIDSDGVDDGPARPEVISRELTADGKGLSLKFRLPTLSKAGNPISGQLKWTAVDALDDETLSGTANAGEEVSVVFPSLTDGEHNVRFYTSINDNAGVSRFVNAWVGNDKPGRVENIRVTPSGVNIAVEWDALVKGAHGGVIDKDNVMYALYLKNQKVAETSETKASFKLPAGFKDPKLEVSIIASCGEQQSDPSFSPSVWLYYAQELPFTLVPTDDQAMMVTIINPDEDNSEWRLGKDFSNKNAFFCPADSKNNSDDWLILPPIKIEDASVNYKVSLVAAGNSNTKTEEYIEVTVGTGLDLEDMEYAFPIPVTKIDGTSNRTLSGEFKVERPGDYFIGVHCVSHSKMSGVYVSNIKVDKSDGSGVETIFEGDDAFNVSISGNEILINAEAGKSVIVYSVDGKCVLAGYSDGSLISIPVTSGVYIVKSDKNRVKVRI